MPLVSAPVASDPGYWVVSWLLLQKSSLLPSRGYFHPGHSEWGRTYQRGRMGWDHVGRQHAHGKAGSRLPMGMGQQIAYGDRRTGCFREGESSRAAGGAYLVLSLGPGAEKVSGCPLFLLTILWLVSYSLAVPSLIYLLQIWVKSKRGTLHRFQENCYNPNAQCPQCQQVPKTLGKWSPKTHLYQLSTVQGSTELSEQ